MSRRKQAKPRALKHDEQLMGLSANNKQNNRSKRSTDRYADIEMVQEYDNSSRNEFKNSPQSRPSSDDYNRIDEENNYDYDDDNDNDNDNDDDVEETEDCDENDDDDETTPLLNDVNGEFEGPNNYANNEYDLINNDEDEAADDETTCDSFYSDIYSSHTSLSYSPSLSEGAATPNSVTTHHEDNVSNINNNNNSNNNNNNKVLTENCTNFTTNNHRQQQQQQQSHLVDLNEKEMDGVPASTMEASTTTTTKTSSTESNTNTLSSGSASMDYSKLVNTNTTTSMVKSTTTQLMPPSTMVTNNESGASTKTSSKINGKPSKLVSNATNNNNTNNGGEGSYHCQFCDKSFPRLGYLKKHEQSHAEHMPFKCEYCARLFKHKRSRDRHTKLHTGDRRYRCPHCEAAFSRSDHLKIHMKTHDNQKPFQCTVCNRGYNTAAALTSHMQNHKKQAALHGNLALTYSPRSTGSASSGNSLHKRKYSPHIDQHQANSNHSDFLATNAKRAASNCSNNSILYCIYCTKADFDTLDQLHAHIQQMHAALLREATPTAFAAQPNLQLTCEFCTMKFPSISTMFQHIRSTHIDRINSPTTYIEHFNRIANNYGTAINSPFRGDDLFKRTNIEENLHLAHQMHLVKAEQNPSPKLEPNAVPSGSDPDELVRKTPQSEHEHRVMLSESDIKQEEQDSPTDLSNKKSGSKENGNRSDQFAVNHDSSNCTSIPSPASGNAVHLAQQTKTSHDTVNNNVASTFMCNQCNAALPDFEAFRNHLKSHLAHGELKSFVCHHCGMTLANQGDYDRHCLSHFLISNTEYCCTFNCNKSFDKSDSLQKHLFELHAQNFWKCGICSEVFDSKVAIQVHFAVAHSNEVKTFRCSACMELFKTESEFKNHVRTRHTLIPAGNLQCMFCRTICGSELEMHFHLTAHARQYRCPACPEAFHVEFLLDRHMQTRHCPTGKDSLVMPYKANNNNNNNNNNMLDYHYSLSSSGLNNTANAKNLYPFVASVAHAAAASKLYNPLQIETAASVSPHKPTPSLYGFYDNIGKSRYGDIAANKHLMNLYNAEYASKVFLQSDSLVLPPPPPNTSASAGVTDREQQHFSTDNVANKSDFYHLRNVAGKGYGGSNNSIGLHGNITSENKNRSDAIFVCGICERSDFNNEMDVHTHRKVAHNVKTGVSLRCAYCNDNFRSRNELENHMKLTHNTSGKHKCLICDEIFPSPTVLAEHKLNHSKIGVSGKCFHCSANLLDILSFKNHMTEHGGVEAPVQCICCRQTLNSKYEIELHAKFHTKSNDNAEHACALCLTALPSTSDAKVCEKCFKKHNFNQKYSSYAATAAAAVAATVHEQNPIANQEKFVEHHCNICKKHFSSVKKLEEHLIEHSFQGCDDRGYSCYICSAVFTLSGGLHQHMAEHGPNSRPYDCNLCPNKFFFRAELENHLIDHQNGRLLISPMMRMPMRSPPTPSQLTSTLMNQSVGMKHEANSGINDTDADNESDCDSAIKTENLSPQAQNDDNNDEDDEYIEIEQIAEHPPVEFHRGNDEAATEHSGGEDVEQCDRQKVEIGSGEEDSDAKD